MDASWFSAFLRSKRFSEGRCLMATDDYKFTRKIVCKDCYETCDSLIVEYFRYAHLPEKLQNISKPFSEIAQSILSTIPASPERSAGLRKLLEAKDCMVRAAL